MVRIGPRLGCLLLAWTLAAVFYINNHFCCHGNRSRPGTGGGEAHFHVEPSVVASQLTAPPPPGRQDADKMDTNPMPKAPPFHLAAPPSVPTATTATLTELNSDRQQESTATMSKDQAKRFESLTAHIENKPKPTRPVVTWTHPSAGWKGAIGVLVKYERRVRKMQEKIKSMLHTISVQVWGSRYPILLFMDSADAVTHVPPKHFKAIAECVDTQNLEIVWIDVSAIMFEARGSFIQVYRWSKGENGGSTTTDKDRGYRAMCQFWSNLVYSVPEVAGLDALMRLDDDSWLATDTAADPLLAFKESGASYSYQMAYRNRPDRHMSTNLIQHLAEFVGGRAVLEDMLQQLRDSRDSSASTTSSHGGKTIDACPNVRLFGINDTYVPEVIYNNLFITRPALWTADGGVARAFFDFVSAREGFRRDGIGDAEFHTVVVCILAQAERKAGGASGEASLAAYGVNESSNSVWPVAVLPVAYPYRHGASMADPDHGGMQMTIPGCDYWNSYIPSNGCNMTPAC